MEQLLVYNFEGLREEFSLMEKEDERNVTSKAEVATVNILYNRYLLGDGKSMDSQRLIFTLLSFGVRKVAAKAAFESLQRKGVIKMKGLNVNYIPYGERYGR